MQSFLNNSSADTDRVAECGEHPFPNRQSIRLKGRDYASPGDYFVTINTQGGRPLFGTVVKGKMALNEAGRIAEAEWRKSPEIRRDIALDEFIIMPTHMHGIVRLHGREALRGRGALHGREALQGLGAPSPYPQFGKPVAGHLNPGGMLECLLSDAPPDLEIDCL